jgi:hypothetical protein
MTFHVTWKEDGTATALARITARNGSGDATGVNGEGNWLQAADISTITYKLFDLDGSTPTTATESGSLTVANVVLDTPVTTNVIWTKDTTGYNFIHDLTNTWFPNPNRRYRMEYTVTLTGGAVFHGVYEGATRPITGS